MINYTFEKQFDVVKDKINATESVEELYRIRRANEKKYWWTSIFFCGLFYAIYDDIGRFVLAWVLGFLTLGIYPVYLIYTSYRDQNQFNSELNHEVYIKIEKLKGNAQKPVESNADLVECPNCALKMYKPYKFCPNCGKNLEDLRNPNFCFCTNCGSKILDDSLFCSECGRKVF